MAVAEVEYEDARTVEGSAEALVKLVEWLTPMVRSIETEGDLHVTLHQKHKMGEQEIAEFEFVLGSGETIDKFARKIVSEAEDDALEGVGKFNYSVRVDGRPGRCLFKLNVPVRPGTDDEEEFDEMPNPKGQAHQAMRHTEVMFRMASAAMTNANNQIMQMARETREENLYLKRHQHEQIKITEQLRSMQFARDIKIEEMNEAKERKKRLISMAEKALPVVAAKLLGGGTQMASDMAGQASPVDGLLTSLVSSLEQKPEKLQALMTVLDPVDLAAFAELHKYVAAQRERTAQQQAQEQQGEALAKPDDEPES